MNRCLNVFLTLLSYKVNDPMISWFDLLIIFWCFIIMNRWDYVYFLLIWCYFNECWWICLFVLLFSSFVHIHHFHQFELWFDFYGVSGSISMLISSYLMLFYFWMYMFHEVTNGLFQLCFQDLGDFVNFRDRSLACLEQACTCFEQEPRLSHLLFDIFFQFSTSLLF